MIIPKITCARNQRSQDSANNSVNGFLYRVLQIVKPNRLDFGSPFITKPSPLGTQPRWSKDNGNIRLWIWSSWINAIIGFLYSCYWRNYKKNDWIVQFERVKRRIFWIIQKERFCIETVDLWRSVEICDLLFLTYESRITLCKCCRLRNCRFCGKEAKMFIPWRQSIPPGEEQ